MQADRCKHTPEPILYVFNDHFISIQPYLLNQSISTLHFITTPADSNRHLRHVVDEFGQNAFRVFGAGGTAGPPLHPTLAHTEDLRDALCRKYILDL